MNYRDKAGKTPLHLAIQHGSTSVIEFLISHGADLNMQSLAGETSLHLAVKMDLAGTRVEITEALREVYRSQQ